MEALGFKLEYTWEPFTYRGQHLTFAEHCSARLNSADCSHWGPAVYKWEGSLAYGHHAGEAGVLIGETGDLRQRIKQYISGTQKSGNKYWREEFLTKGDVCLYVLRVVRGMVRTPEGGSVIIKMDNLAGNNLRLVLEQLLVLRESARKDAKLWVVNRKL